MQQPESIAQEGTVRLHANTRSMIIAPAESLLGNVIHHSCCCRHQHTRGGGIEGHSAAQIDG